jgi:MFS family permease
MRQTHGTASPLPGLSRKPGFYYGYVIVIVCFITMVFGWGIFYIYGVFFSPLSEEFHWSRVVTSGAFSLSVLISGLAGIVAGRVSDRVGPKRVIIFCTILLALGYALMSIVHNKWEFYLFYGLIVASGVGGFWAPPVSTVARWFVARRGLMTGIVSGGISFGTLVLPPVAAKIIEIWDWRIAYLFIAGLVLVIVLVAAQFLRREPSEIMDNPGAQTSLLSKANKSAQSVSNLSTVTSLTLKEAFHTRQFWMVATIYLIFGFSQLTIMVHIVPYATGSGISTISAAGILSFIGGSSLAGRIITGSIADRLRVRVSTILCLGLLLISLLWLQFSDNLWELYIFAGIFGFGYGGLSCLQSLISAELFGLKALGSITAIFSLSFDVGGAIGPVLAGLIYDISESYRWAFFACLLVLGSAMIISLYLKPTGEKDLRYSN